MIKASLMKHFSSNTQLEDLDHSDHVLIEIRPHTYFMAYLSAEAWIGVVAMILMVLVPSGGLVFKWLKARRRKMRK
jgi:hypothetical protein